MRDRETIDSELRRVAAELRSIRERGGRPSSQQVDALLDERLGHPVEVLCDTAVLDEILAPFEETFERPRRRRRGGLLRPALRAAVPLSVLAVGSVLVVTLLLHRHERPSVPASIPVSEEQPGSVAAPPVIPPAKASASPTDIAEKAMIDALQHEGVPVPNRDYVARQGHAVCDFLGRNANFSEAAQFVQRSTIWDAHQSADFATAAIVTYCPQFESTGNDQAQQTFEKSLTNLQAVQGDLQGINRDLQDISDGLRGGS